MNACSSHKSLDLGDRNKWFELLDLYVVSLWNHELYNSKHGTASQTILLMEMYEIYLPSHVFKNGTRSKFVWGPTCVNVGRSKHYSATAVMERRQASFSLSTTNSRTNHMCFSSVTSLSQRYEQRLITPINHTLWLYKYVALSSYQLKILEFLFWLKVKIHWCLVIAKSPSKQNLPIVQVKYN